MAEIVKRIIYVTVQGSNKVIEITPAFRGVTLTEVKNDTDIANAITNTHTHANKALLDTYAPENFASSTHEHDNRYYTETEVDTLLSGKSDITHNHTLSSLAEKSYNSLTDKPDLSSLHTHSNKSVLDNLTQTVINNSHQHSNKELLDTYTNTNTDITNAINNMHSHANKTDLDNYNPSNFALSNHNHNSLYYQKSEVDNKIMYIFYPTSFTVGSGSYLSGTISNLQTVGPTLVFSSNSSQILRVDFTITGVEDLSIIFTSFLYQSSLDITLKMYIYDYTASGWVEIDTFYPHSSEWINREYTSSYSSPFISNKEVKIRFETMSIGATTLSLDRLYISKYPSTWSSYLATMYSPETTSLADNDKLYVVNDRLREKSVKFDVIKNTLKNTFYTKSEVDNALSQKQDTLVSGANIKTINNQSILGTGNLLTFSNIPIYDNGTKTTAFNIDYSNGVVQKVTLGASLAFGISDPSDTSKTHTLYLYVYQDNTGGRLWNGVNGTNIALSSSGNKYKQLLSASYGMYAGSRNAVMSADNNIMIWWYINKMYYYNIPSKRLYTYSTSPYTLYFTSDIICYNNKYYMFGGSSTISGGTYYDYFIEFDGTNYTNIAPTTGPSARNQASLILYNNKAYLLGGYNGSSTLSDLWVYDFSSGGWTQLASCPVTIRGGISFVYNNELYFGCGSSVSSIYAYNPTNNTWRDATPIGISGLYGFFCAYVHNTNENKVYIFGVSNANGHISYQTGYIDLTTNKFYLMPDVNGVNGYLAVSAYNPAENCIYIVHSTSTSFTFLSRFNPPHGGELTKEILNTLPNAMTLLLFQWDGTKWVLMNR